MTEPKIIRGDRPPNFTAIVKVFPKAAKATTIFAYDNTIYLSCPVGVLTKALLEHEKVHLRRQRAIGVEEWWAQYLTDEAFRYEEELLAHRKELQVEVMENKDIYRDKIIKKTTLRLIAPLYNWTDLNYHKAKDHLLLNLPL